jgi:hypothetical protein
MLSAIVLGVVALLLVGACAYVLTKRSDGA